MRNLKKILAVICVIAMMATIAVVPALAASFSYETQATTLNTLGVMNGMNLGNSVTRIEALTFAIKAAGKDAAVKAMTAEEVTAGLANVVDADKIPTWGRAYAAYAVTNNFTKGVDASILPKIKFNPAQNVSGDSFIYWMVYFGMGYTDAGVNNAWETASTTAKALTLSQGYTFHGKATLVRDDVAGILYGALDNGVNKDGKAFVDALIASGLFTQQQAADAGLSTPPAPAALAATVTALNTKQVQVVFNKEVNADDAKNVAKYEIKNKGDTVVAISGAALAADNKTVTLTLGVGAGVKLDNNTTAKVTVKKDFRDAAGTKIAADLAYDVVVADTTFPTFDSVEAVGLKTLRLHFSEPVTGVDATDFSIKSGSYTWTIVGAPKVDDAAKTVELTLGTNLIEGNISVKVNSSVITDFALLPVFEKTVTYAFAKTSAAPVASIDSIKPGEVKIKFDRPVYGQIGVSFGVKDYDTYEVSQSAIESGATDAYTFNFSAKKIPAGTVTIYVYSENATNAPIKDLYGNKFVDTSFATTVVADTAAPVVSSTKVNTNKTFDVIFDESIDATEAVKTANYSLTKADGTAVLFTVTLGNDGTGTNNKITIDPAGDFADSTTYQLTIKLVKDTEGNKNSSDIAQSFTIGDETAPKLTKDSFAVKADGKIYLYFSEAMNEAAMLNKANYMVVTDHAIGGNFVALGDDDTVSRISEKVVLIDLKSAVNKPDVQISTNVTDLAGKKLTTSALYMNSTELAELATGIPVETLAIDKAEAISTTKVKITFTKELSQFDSADVIIQGTTTNPVTISAVDSVSGKEVVVSLAGDGLRTDAMHLTAITSVSISAVASPANTKTVYGSVLTTPSAAVVQDKIAPAVSKPGDDYLVDASTIPTFGGVNVVAKDAQGTIVITFTEAIDPATISKFSFSVAGYTVTGAAVTGAGDQITLYVKSLADNTTYTPDVTQVYDIADANGNVLTKGTTWHSTHTP